MGWSQDLQDQIQRNGNKGSGLSTHDQMRANAQRNSGIISAIDPITDIQWEEAYGNQAPINPYFDYYFTGQDIQVYIDGLDEASAELPLASLSWSIQQQKQPVYGFWSYTHDGVMRGTRSVNIAMSLYTTTTDYMARMLSAAAKARQEGKGDYVMRGLDIDERNIDKYWGRNINDDARYSGGKHIFSTHPPFNLVIVYGIQSSSITSSGDDRMAEIVSRYRNSNTPLMTDTNERLVATEEDNAMRIVLENCEIVAQAVGYNPDGTPIVEQYQMFARDVITPKLGTNRISNRKPIPPENRV